MGENRIYHESGLHKRIACLIGAVLVVLMCITAAVPVSAADLQNNFLDQFPYVAKDSFGIIYLSYNPLSFVPFTRGSYTQPEMYIGVVDYQYLQANMHQYIMLVPDTTSDIISYNIYTVGSSSYIANVDLLEYKVSYESPPSGYIYFKGLNKNIMNTSFDIWIDITKFRQSSQWTVGDYIINANYTPYFTYNGDGPTSNPISTSQAVVNPDYSISDAVGQSGITEDQLINAITVALQTQTNTIINYGNQYIQFLPTDKVNNLSSKQQALHEKESAIDTKSKSLVSKASAGLATATASAVQLASNLAQPVAAVGTVITNVTAKIPDEVKPVLTAAPLLSFIVWLIGLRR